MHIYHLLYTNTLYGCFWEKPHILMFMLGLNLQILLPLFRFLKVNIALYPPWFISSLYCFFLPHPPLKAGNRVLGDLRGKIFLSAGGSRKLSERSVVLSAFLLPFPVPPWWSEEEKEITCMYLYICVYIYISCYNNSTSQWLSELLNHHHTYLPYINKFKWCCRNNSRRKKQALHFS